jgi:RNA polymerase sigma-54 factor
MPRVLVDSGYCETMRTKARCKSDREFLTENLAAANWLVKALQQRANTILKTSTEIVRRQEGFFREGIVGLRPMTLKDVAEAIEMHESTISRVVNGKYIATPRGVVELKSFFTVAISGSGDGDAQSAEAVRHRVKSLIDAERPDAVLSDDRIVELLKAEGVDIARRTVAKYREALRIPSSVQRRRQKLALAS